MARGMQRRCLRPSDLSPRTFRTSQHSSSAAKRGRPMSVRRPTAASGQSEENSLRENVFQSVQNVAQANKFGAFDHLEHLDRLGLDLRPQHWVQTLARGEVCRPAKNVRQSLAQADQFDEAEALGIVVDEEIDIAVVAR